MKKNSPKNRRVSEEVSHELSKIIRELKDPRVAPLTSVVEAIVAPDLKTCKVYISIYGDEKSQKDTMAGLRSAEGFIRRELAHSLNLRNTPELTFIFDGSIERGVAMSKRIDEVMAADRAAGKETEEDV
ncbi:MAG: 30S ribosome-binding factor RbfA [bacterium]